MFLNAEEEDPFIYYDITYSSKSTLRYLGTKSEVKVPQKKNHITVTQIECTTFYGNSDIETVKINNNITKIF